MDLTPAVRPSLARLSTVNGTPRGTRSNDLKPVRKTPVRMTVCSSKKVISLIGELPEADHLIPEHVICAYLHVMKAITAQPRAAELLNLNTDFDDSEHRKLFATIAQVERDERCVQRAASLVAALTAL